MGRAGGARCRLALVVALGLAAGVGGWTRGPASSPARVRYRDRVFATADVTKDLTYGSGLLDGSPVPMQLDLWEPHGDPAAARPIMIWMHGQGIGAGKASPQDIDIVTRFVQHGFVVVSIDYRYESVEPLDDIVVEPLAAARWVRAHAVEHRIDTTRIVFAGASAGAIRALHAGYDADIGAGAPPADERVDAVLSFSGKGDPDRFQPGEPPLFMANGELDTAVPYADAVATCDGADAAGVPCDLHSYPNTDHLGMLTYVPELEGLSTAWMYDVLDLVHAAQDPPSQAPTTTTATTTTTSVASPTTIAAPDPGRAPPATPIDRPAHFSG